MPPTNEQASNNTESFPNLEGLERDHALLNKLGDLMPDESLLEEPWSYDEYGKIVGTEYLLDITMSVARSGND